MKRTTYKGYVIDHDTLGRLYVYNTASPMSEDNDKDYITSMDHFVDRTELQGAKHYIDKRIEREAAERANVAEAIRSQSHTDEP